MLTEGGTTVLSSVLFTGCNILKLYPYTWDYVNFVLRPPSRLHLLIFKFHHAFASTMALLSVYHWAATTNWENIPEHVRLLQAVGLVAHSISAVCFIQFWVTGEQIMLFVNSLWRYVLNNRDESMKQDFVSACTIFGGVFLYFDIPGHSMGALDVHHLTETLPHFLLDTYLLSLQLSVLFFNWVFVFLGLAWIRRELKKVSLTCAVSMPTNSAQVKVGSHEVVDEFGAIISHYRQCQLINYLLNESFRLYLAWFPIFLLGMITLELVGMINHWDLPIQEYWFFPACALRCLFESMTLLRFAGKLADESKGVLAEWRENLVVEQGKKATGSFKWMCEFQRSCQEIDCKSGSFYPFDNSILLCSLTNCIELTTSLLIMSNKNEFLLSEGI